MTKILVVEDDEKINEAVCRCLVDAGYGIKGCLNGENALEQMDKEKFDMVISDIMMPGMDGFALAQEIRAVDKALPILLPPCGKGAQSRFSKRTCFLRRSNGDPHYPETERRESTRHIMTEYR